MIRHSAETKAAALTLIQQKGVQKTHEETGLSVQTLYKWKRDNEAKSSAKNPDQLFEIQSLLNDDTIVERIKRLETENSRLAEQNLKLRKVLQSLLED